jgi:hypothetical protein
MGIYLSVTHFATFKSYQASWLLQPAFPWEHFSEMGERIANHLLSPTDIFNIFVTLLFGALCIVIWLRLPWELGLYATAMFLLPLFGIHPGQPLSSMSRYLLVLFPVFFLWGRWGKKAWVNRLILYSSFPLALFFSAQFWMWGWVS